uniref:Uncharacterized protein n=1 Tax=Arundo donax TaxID=35708 RepID=A0A0A9FQH0_ARUDO
MQVGNASSGIFIDLLVAA